MQGTRHSVLSLRCSGSDLFVPVKWNYNPHKDNSVVSTSFCRFEEQPDRGVISLGAQTFAPTV